MRSDMWKVIVERPRLGRTYADAVGRRARKLAPGDHEGLAFGVTERGARTKSLNENLAPLRRYLERQVGRPWDKVYSEMRAQISFDNVVQKHVLAHLDQLLWRNVRIVDGVVESMDRWTRRVPPRGALYVHPRTGIIRTLRPARAPALKRSDLASLGPRACLLRIEGVWFHVTLAPLPWPAPPDAIDVVTRRRAEATWSLHPSRDAHLLRYGMPHVYAIAKRQLSKRELRVHRAAGRIL